MRIVGVAGAIGSGKSEFSRALASDLGAARVSFGDLVRRQADARGVEPSRQNLQEVGEQLLDELGAPEFVRRVLAAPEFVRRVLAAGPAGDLLIADGVRHVAVDDALTELADRYLLVFVEVDDETRRRRLAQREGRDVDLATLDRHSTEREVPLLRKRAKAVVDGCDSDRAVGQVRELLQ